jgi:hypothetical protein
MFIYNVSLKIDWSAVEEWLRWMREEHIAEVLATGCFFDANMFKLLEQDDTEGPTFIVQYTCNKKIDYLKYKKDFAPALQEKGAAKFGTSVVAFRSIMEKL